MPILLAKRTLTRSHQTDHSGSCCTNEGDEQTSRRKRKHIAYYDGSEEVPQKKRNCRSALRSDDHISVAEEALSSEVIQWKTITDNLDAVAALVVEANVIQNETIVCKQLVQQAQAVAKEKEYEFSVIMAQIKQAMSKVQSSLEDGTCSSVNKGISLKETQEM